MYNPLQPNTYRIAKIERVRQQRQLKEGVKSRSVLGQGKGTSFLSDALLSAATSSSLLDIGTSVGVAAVPAAEGSALPPLAPLNASAEELHRMRVSRSAALGVQRAVELEREELEIEHKRHKFEGKDTKSRIASLLGKMRQSAVCSESEKEGGSASASADGGDANAKSGTMPLVFKPAPLAAGGYVMVPAGPGTGGGGTLSEARAFGIRGKPSNTLLLNYARDPPTIAFQGDNSGDTERACAFCCEEVRAACGAYGIVRSVRWYALTPKEEEGLLKARKLTPSKLLCERLRVFVRFDTVADAFRAAEGLTSGRTQSRWSVAFFPSALYDRGELGPEGDDRGCANDC